MRSVKRTKKRALSAETLVNNTTASLGKVVQEEIKERGMEMTELEATCAQINEASRRLFEAGELLRVVSRQLAVELETEKYGTVTYGKYCRCEEEGV